MFRVIVWAIFAAAPIFTAVANAESCSDDDIWRCNDGSCISIDKKCDGKFDCPDNSDETHPLCWKNYCAPSRFRCAYGACVDAMAPCNGDEDCADGSDELLPRCRNNEEIVVSGEFTCFHDDKKILASSLCDGVKDCASGDDELLAYCGGLRCQPNQFQCAYGACVDPHSDCNEDLKWDCADGSDETDLLCNRTTVIVGSTTTELVEVIKPCDGFRCKNGVCMSDDLRCNGVAECPYNEDELDCDAGKCSGKFTCGDGSCVKLNARCNGKTDCPDGSDETHAFCRNFTETDGWFGDGKAYCLDGSDGIHAFCRDFTEKCPEDKFRCTYGACVDESAPCNGVPDCADGSDELLAKCRNETLIVNGEFTCRNGEKLAAGVLCNGIEDCVDGSDETLASCADFKCADADEFQCAYGACVDINSVCDADRNNTCADGSDEDDVLCNRPPSETKPVEVIKPCDGFRCKNGVCLSDDLRCNGVAECPYNEDELDCDAGKCSGKFTCGDGSCVKLNARCNGKTDCPDGSDETHAFCRNFTETCPEDKFRCTYGACVDESAPCDGVQDCADGSDELLAKCRNETLIVNGEFTCRKGEKLPAGVLCNGIEDCVDGSDETLASCADFKCADADQFQCAYGACVDINSVCDADRNNTCADGSDEDDVLCNRPPSKGKFNCKNGEKISSTDLCDGVKNCADGSDESLESCAGRRCAPYLFQCAYGACVDADAECNEDGTQHCADGSDESDELCNRTSTAPVNQPSKCVLPPYPEHGTYTVSGRAGARPGHVLDAASLTVTCQSPYYPDGAAQVHCYNGQWYSPLPECKRFCKLTPHPSVTYSCKPTDPNILSGDRKCNEFEPSGTEVHPRCNDNYYHNGVLSYMYCIDGSWDNVATCEPECGTLTPNGEPLVINGVSAKRGELPWHAGIYDKRFTPFMQICGGSLASTTVIISAAHCFWNDVERVLPAKYFAVGVGKLYRPWNIEEGGQKSDVSDIKVPPRFLGAGNNFQDDIALVILVTPVVLANYVRPVCIDFNVLFDERQLQPGNVGKVAGWGLTSEDGNASQVLKVTELPYVDVEQCIADLPFDFRSYITSDKICAGTKHGTALCKGDSGGGLVFPEVERSVQRWYLRGVVSTAPSNGHKCNANSYTSFTQLLKHDDFVRKHLNNR